MTSLMLHSPNFIQRKKEKIEVRSYVKVRSPVGSSQARANAAMHAEVAERARAIGDLDLMTKVDSSMSRDEITATVRGMFRRATAGR